MHVRNVPTARLFAALFCGLIMIAPPAGAQGGPPPEMRRVVDATVAVLESSNTESIVAFADAHLSVPFRHSMSEQALVAQVEAIRAAVQPHRGEFDVEGSPDGVRLLFGGESGVEVRLQVGPATQWRIAGLQLMGDGAGMAQVVTRDDAIRRHTKAIERVARQPAGAALDTLEAGHLVPGLFNGPQREALLADLAGLREVVAAAGMIQLEQRGDDIILQFRGGKPGDVVFAVGADAPFAITRLAIDLDPPIKPREAVAPLRWEELDSRLRAAEGDGFSGVVVAQRDGRTTLSEGYGLADRTNKYELGVDTVFDIGSMPIDFTRAAILWLSQEGRLSLNDPISKFFPLAPVDKRDISLGQLMTGRSGLANFHHRDGDSDKDLTFIDRETALRRILEEPLLFAPGEGESHSHSAFGLLAMVVEIVSGDSYADFLRKQLFDPAGMSRTGYYGEMLGLDISDFAVGYGNPASAPNIPPLWGPASWLVIGSGGMVSSVADMQRGYNYILGGSWLRGEALDDYQRLRVGIGGSDRGFFFLRVGGDQGDALFLASNSDKGPAANEALVRSLIGMVLPDRAGAGGK